MASPQRLRALAESPQHPLAVSPQLPPVKRTVDQ